MRIEKRAKDIFSLWKKHKDCLTAKEDRDNLLRGLKSGIEQAIGRNRYTDDIYKLREINSFILNDSLKHNLRISDDGLFVVYNSGKSLVKTTFIKYISKFRIIRMSMFPEHVYCYLSNVVMGHAGGYNHIESNCKYYSGKDIMKVYEKEGNRFDSCMAGDCSIFTKLYALNPKKVKLVVLRDKKKVIVARALLWTCDNGSIVLDRVYPSGSKYTDMFVSWAKGKGFLMRDHVDSYDSRAQLSGKKVKVTLKFPKALVFPYLDTFKYGCVEDVKSRNIILQNWCEGNNYGYFNNNFITLTHTGGGYSGKTTGISFLQCKKCGDRFNHITYLENRGHFCHYCLKNER